MASKNNLEVKIAVALDTTSIQTQLADLEKRISNIETKIKINADTSSAEKQTKTLSEKLNSVGNSMTQVGNALQTVFGGAVDLAKESISIYTEFDRVMANIKATTGTTGSELQSLTDLASELAKTTQYSSTEAAEAMLALAKGGMGVEQIMGAIPNVLNLATVGELELADSADYTTKIINSFGLASDDAATMVTNATRIIDVMAKACNDSTLDVGELATYLGNCSGTGELLGYSIEDVCAVLMVLSDNGLQAGKATIALRNIMMTMAGGELKLVADGMEDIVINTQNTDGSMRSLQDILLDCNTAFGGMTDAQKIQAATTLVGKTNAEAFVKAVTNANGSLQTNTEKLYDASGAAQDYNDTIMDTPYGQYKILEANIDELKKAIGEGLLPVLNPFVKGLTKVVEKLGEMNPAVLAIVVGGGALLGVVGSLLIFLGSIATAFEILMPIVAGVGAFLGGISLSVVGIGVAIVALGVIIYEVIKHWDELKEKATELVKPIVDKFNEIKNKVVAVWEGFSEKVAEKWNDLKELIGEKLKGVVEKVSEFISPITDKFGEMKNKAISAWTGLKEGLGQKVTEANEKIKEMFGVDILAWFSQKKDEAVAAWTSLKEGIGQKVSDAVEGIKTIFNGGVPEWFSQKKEEAIGAWTSLKEGLSQKVIEANEGIKAVFGIDVIDWFGQKKNEAVATWVGLKEGLSQKVTEAKEGIKTVFGTDIPEWFSQKKEEAIGAWTSLKEGLSQKANDAKEGIKTTFNTDIPNWFSQKKEEVVAAWATLKEGLSQKVSEAKQGMKTWIDKMPSDWSGAIGYIGQTWDNLKQATINKVSEMANGIVTKIQEMVRNFINKILGLKNEVLQKIQEIKNGIIEKFTGAFNSADTGSSWSSKTQSNFNKVGNSADTNKSKVSSLGNTINNLKSKSIDIVTNFINNTINNVKSIFSSETRGESLEQTLETQGINELDSSINISKTNRVLSMQEIGGQINVDNSAQNSSMIATNNAIANLSGTIAKLDRTISRMNSELGKLDSKSEDIQDTNVTINNNINAEVKGELDFDDIAERMEARQQYQLRKLGVFDK